MASLSILERVAIALLSSFLFGGAISAYFTAGHERASLAALQAQEKVKEAQQSAQAAALNATITQLKKQSADFAQKAADATAAAQARQQVKTQTITKEIVKYVPKPVPVKQHDSSCVDRLNNHAVKLLNDAATPSPSVPAPASAGQSDAAPEAAPDTSDTDVGLQQLAQHDATIAGQYNELADQANSLIDTIQNYQKQQADLEKQFAAPAKKDKQ